MNRNESKFNFILMDFPEFTISHESQREFQFIISKILDYHNQERLWNLHFKLFLSIDLLRKLIVS